MHIIYIYIYISKNMLETFMVCGVDIIASSVLLIGATLQCLWFQEVTESGPKTCMDSAFQP